MVLALGSAAPALVGNDVTTGAPFDLSAHLGKTVLVGFNGLSWCAPCQYEAPIVQALWEKWQHLPHVEFVLVSVNDATPAATKNATTSLGLTMPVLRDAGPIAPAWDVDAVPTIYIVETDGTICNVKVGVSGTPAELEQAIDDLIAACAPPPPNRIIADLDRFQQVWRILFGVINDGGGIVWGPNGPHPVDPWGPLRISPAGREAIRAVLQYEAAAAAREPSLRTAAQAAALQSVELAAAGLRSQVSPKAAFERLGAKKRARSAKA